MNHFTIETSRRQSMTALDRAKEVFSDQLHQYSDALFFDAKRDRVFAFTGLRYHAPVCTHLINDPQIYTYLKDIDGDILFNEDLDLYYNGRFHSIDGPLKERFQVILDRIYSSPGTLNDKGELCIDLKSYHIGSHYGVNLLLGERSEYADCLQSTPKSVLDEFGRGSFRGKQEKQVLATRYVLSPDENGEPANRQFYITENGKQIFYPLDVRHNVKEAYCLHSQNRTIIT